MRTIFCAGLILLSAGGVARADVIEISDDGEAHVLGMPSPAGPEVSGAVTAVADDHFANAARRHGVDVELLRAVAWTESRGRNDAVSPKGARGIMQLMPATAAELGVDPRDPKANIDGGAAYLARQIATFHAVPLALAAYNAGPGAVIRYRGVPPYAETRKYVANIMQRWSPVKAVRPAVLPVRDAPEAPAPEEPVFLIEVPSP